MHSHRLFREPVGVTQACSLQKGLVSPNRYADKLRSLAVPVCTARKIHTSISRSFKVASPGEYEQGKERNGDSKQKQDVIPEEIVEQMKEKIKVALEAESVQISDTYGDGRHISIDVVASSFEGKSSVKRQQSVYKAIWLELQDTVHAVDAMTTKTPAEAGH